MKALLVINMQEVIVGKDHSKRFRYKDDMISKVNSVIEQNDFVVYIRNLFKNNFINRLGSVKFFDGTPEAELAEGLKIVSEHRFDKYTPCAFSNEELGRFLKKNGCDTIELVGVDGGACVAVTAIGALNSGFKAILNTSAIGTMFESKRRYYYRILRKMGAQFI